VRGTRIAALFTEGNRILWQAGVQLADKDAGGAVNVAAIQRLPLSDQLAGDKNVDGWHRTIKGNRANFSLQRGRVCIYFVRGLTDAGGFTHFRLNDKSDLIIVIGSQGASQHDGIVAHEFAHTVGKLNDLKYRLIDKSKLVLSEKYRNIQNLMLHDDYGTPKKLWQPDAHHLWNRVNTLRTRSANIYNFNP